MADNDPIEPGEPAFWTLEEARSILPEIKEFTQNTYQKYAELQNQLEKTILPENMQESVEQELQELINRWVTHILRLGAEAKGLWLVDFDHGSGYFCWNLGEEDVLFEHSYEAGFAGRRPLRDHEEKGPVDPPDGRDGHDQKEGENDSDRDL